MTYMYLRPIYRAQRSKMPFPFLAIWLPTQRKPTSNTHTHTHTREREREREIVTSEANFLFRQIMEAAEDFMYNPGMEEYMFSNLVTNLSTCDEMQQVTNFHLIYKFAPNSFDDWLHKQAAGIRFLESLLKSPHGGNFKAMLRAHFVNNNLVDTLQVNRS